MLQTYLKVNNCLRKKKQLLIHKIMTDINLINKKFLKHFSERI